MEGGDHRGIEDDVVFGIAANADDAACDEVTREEGATAAACRNSLDRGGHAARDRRLWERLGEVHRCVCEVKHLGGARRPGRAGRLGRGQGAGEREVGVVNAGRREALGGGPGGRFVELAEELPLDAEALAAAEKDEFTEGDLDGRIGLQAATVDIGAVGAAEVLDPDGAVAEEEAAVAARDHGEFYQPVDPTRVAAEIDRLSVGEV